MPGRIQSGGALIVVAGDTHRVLQVSANLEQFLGVAPEAALGQSLRDLLGETNTQRVYDLPIRGDLQPSVPAFFRLDIGERMSFLAAQVHHVAGDLVIEVEPCEETEQQYFSQLFVSTRNSLWESDVESEAGYYCDLIAQQVRKLTGFDRVMIYRFDPQWNGEVVAESRTDRMPSLLAHHFPAGDIPAQARRLYARNLIRVLADIDAPTVPLMPPFQPITGRPLDMSRSVLRSMSPIHIEYLRNMGAYATISISLMVSGRLWGLIACHHAEPRKVPFQIRDLAEFVGKTASLKLSSLESNARSNYLNQVQETVIALTRNIRESGDVGAALVRLNSDVLNLTRATGAVVSIGGLRYKFGNVPSAAEVDALRAWLATHSDGEVYHTDCLQDSYPPAAAFSDSSAGLLAVRLDDSFTDFVLWFREERIRTISWGGNPEKSLVIDADGPRIEPRRSFARWIEQQHGHCSPWTSNEIDSAQTLSLTLVEALARKALASANKRTESRLKFLASHDPLTGLPNRVLLGEELEKALRNAATNDQTLAVVFIDLDDFKVVNDALGHLMGDRFLQEIALRLGVSIRHGDVLARWGGDEFVVVIDGVRGRSSVGRAVSRLHAELTKPMTLDGRDFSPSASIGVALYPGDGKEAEHLLHAADTAMYRAKENGRNGFEFYAGS